MRCFLTYCRPTHEWGSSRNRLREKRSSDTVLVDRLLSSTARCPIAAVMEWQDLKRLLDVLSKHLVSNGKLIDSDGQVSSCHEAGNDPDDHRWRALCQGRQRHGLQKGKDCARRASIPGPCLLIFTDGVCVLVSACTCECADRYQIGYSSDIMNAQTIIQ